MGITQTFSSLFGFIPSDIRLLIVGGIGITLIFTIGHLIIYLKQLFFLG